jgi:hypothetical protein
VLALAGCGSEDHPNTPRPPVAPEVTGSISEQSIRLEPATVAVGESSTTDISQNQGVSQPDSEAKDPLVVAFTVANTSESRTRLHFSGPSTQDSIPIAGNGTAHFKLALQTGAYTVSALGLDSRSASFEVGAARVSAQNDLLLP